MKKLTFVNILVLFSMLLLAACGTPATPPPAQVVKETVVVEATKEVKVEVTKEIEVVKELVVTATAKPMKYKESSMLTAKVDKIQLPPVDQRLPENPRVIAALTNEKGKYGGELRIGFVGTSPEWGALLYVGQWEGLLSWSPDFNSYQPNLVEKVVASDDVKEYTFTLRKGIKWSDGDLFDADDIMFYIEDVMYDKDLSPTLGVADWLPSEMRDGFKAEKVDQYTVKFTFPSPYGTFLYNLCTWSGRYFAMYPRHYLEQFHKKYNPKVDDLVKQDGTVTDWMALFYKMGPDNWANPGRWYDEKTDLPSLFPWIMTQPLGAGTQIRLERNPYYWKVDEDGNQLPYIDKILGVSYQDNESRTLAMLNGDVDFVKDPGGENRVLYHDAVDEGKPIFIRYPVSDAANTNTIHFNQTVPDEVKAEIFANKDFRIGMSYAINREELIEIVFNGQGTPAQLAPLNESPFYVEGMDTQYVEYDLDKANEYLDKVLPDKDAQGYRLDKNGKRFSPIFFVKTDLSYGTNYAQIAELLIGYWDKVGIKVPLNLQAGDQFDDNQRKNLIEITIYTAEGGAGVTPLIDPRYYVPMDYFGFFGRGWYTWRIPDPTGQSVAVEPPQWAKDARKKYEDAVAQPTYKQQVEKMKLVIEEAKERFYVLGLARPGASYQPFSTRVGGIPETWFDGWIEGVQKIYYPEQWFIKE